MNRREFLTRRWLTASEAEIGPGVVMRWIRPPFAIDEAAFLDACTKCGACVEACPHGVIFPLSSKAGESAQDTPALDLTNRGCHLCEDYPCVTACEAGALSRPEENERFPRLANARIDQDRCIAWQGPECGACASVCPVPGALEMQGSAPVIVSDKCVGCALCLEACVVQPKAVSVVPL